MTITTNAVIAQADTVEWRRSARAVFAAALVAFFAACGGGGSDTPAAALVTTQPADQSVSVGATATFSVVASGSAPLTYQWSSSTDGTTYSPIGGATASSYNIAATTLGQGGTRFRVVVSNAAGSATSSAATLTVIPVVTPGLSLLAGNIGGRGNFDGTGSAARFNIPYDVAVDSAGNVYVAEFTNSVIRKVTPAGVVTVFAGTPLAKGSNDGTGTAARFNAPQGVAVDGSDNVYVADTGNNAIRKITPGGVVTTLAGTAGAAGSLDGTGAAAQFNRPYGLAVDATGIVYVADLQNGTLRKITPAGVVTTLAGTAGVFGNVDATGAAAQFFGPTAIAIDSSGLLYVVDSANKSIRKVTTAGVVTTVAIAGATFHSPFGIAVDGSGALYVSDLVDDVIWKVAGGAGSILAGTSGSAGVADGLGAAARFRTPAGLAVDAAGNVYVADQQNDTVRKITAAGSVSTLAGLASDTGSADGTAGAAKFDLPWGIAVDAAGNAYVADFNNNAIRKITPAGVVTKLAGTPGVAGSTDGAGAIALFSGPIGVAVDAAGNVYVADQNNATIRKITAGGVVSTLAGTAGVTGSANGLGAAASFGQPEAIAVDSAGNLYVADATNNMVRKITPAGLVSTLAGSGAPGSSDGTGSAAKFFNPEGIAVDAAGTVYVSDTLNHTIREITPAGVVTTLAGLAATRGSADGAGSAARFAFPAGLSADASGDVFVADTGNYTIRKITGAGTVSTVVGVAGEGGIRLGASGRLYGPMGVAAVSSSRLLVTSSAAAVVADLP